ncbi:unnamed protein product [Paramecium pentaurelia]|uniref:AMP deaminase n=1 Tax=Paramecium pentaurelia TaxID=43138 RepID=A0A8S1VHD1_9CILI|nr:unnamed protein product [Paramecium pentaurelia]
MSEFQRRSSQRQGSIEPDAQGLSIQYVAEDQNLQTQYLDLKLARDETKNQKTVFGNQFGYAAKTTRRVSDTADDEIKEALNFDILQIKPGKPYKGAKTKESRESASKILEILKLRDYYSFDGHEQSEISSKFVQHNAKNEPYIIWNRRVDVLPILENTEVLQENGIIFTKSGENIDVIVPTMLQFISDLINLMKCVGNNSIASFCYDRLKFLEQKFQMHEIFNHQNEQLDQKNIIRRDFYNVFKVDTHIHHSAAMSAKHLLEFIQRKYEKNGDDHVDINKDGTKICLRDIFKNISVDPIDLSLNSLDVQADKGIYKRFDRFNNKYNPLGTPKLREIFLKTDNYIKGKYLADLTKELMDQLEQQQYIGCEWRISIYGKSMEEWHKLGKWLIKNKLYSSKVRWMVQIPRLYSVYKKSGMIHCFQDMIDNLFRPLFDITINPTIDPFLYQALFQITGFDTVDDESLYEYFAISDLKQSPKDWAGDRNPPYTYWIYYIYANLYTLNALRQQRGLNTFKFRPHCGEAGNVDHLATAYLVSDGINHGLELQKSPVLQYLFYLKQIGIAMSPVSNNKLFCRYQKSPFQKYFQIGLNVCLSTDDPLILHLTNEPLLEEYAIASQIFDLSAIDQAELARNSVRQSSFEKEIKEFWIGENYNDRIGQKNAEDRNNLPATRFMYRKVTLNEEYEHLEKLNFEELF